MKKQTKEKLNKIFKNKETNFKEVIESLLESLTPLEVRVLRERILVNNYNEVYLTSHQHVGIELGMNYQKTHHVYKKSLRKLRHPSRSSILKNYKKELVRLVDKNNIDDKSICVFIRQQFPREDFIFEQVFGESLSDFFLFR